MKRRRILATLGGVAAGALAGCSAPNSTTGRGGRTTSIPDLGIARHGIPSEICEEEIMTDPGIYAVDDPAFASDWSGLDVSGEYHSYVGSDTEGPLSDDEPVVGVERDGVARAYPISILKFHEVVNDEIDVPLLVTFCPLCDSGMVADRRLDGAATEFYVSGLLWRPPGLQGEVAKARGDVFGIDYHSPESDPKVRANLVMYDARTRSYWSQLLATAICGPLEGDRLRIRPSSTATWGEWRTAHPETDVLLPPPYSGTVNPGGDRESSVDREN